MRLFVAGIILLLIATVFPNHNNFYQADLVDVSWPNCGVKIPAGSRGIVGVTGGKSFTTNPCLASEAGQLANFSLYINTGYPGADRAQKYVSGCSSETCLAYHYGFAAAQAAGNYANSQGVFSSFWWLDVELQNSWSNSKDVNRAAIQGELDGLEAAVKPNQIGFYSHPKQWQAIVGNWHPSYPAWLATGATSRPSQTVCQQASFTSGPLLLVQYTSGLDLNLVCQLLPKIFSAAI